MFPFRVNLYFRGSGVLNPSKTTLDPGLPHTNHIWKRSSNNTLKPQFSHDHTPAFSRQNELFYQFAQGVLRVPTEHKATTARSHTSCRSPPQVCSQRARRFGSHIPQRSGLGITNRKRSLLRRPRSRSHFSFFLFLILTLLSFILPFFSRNFIVPGKLVPREFYLQKSFKFPSISSPHLSLTRRQSVHLHPFLHSTTSLSYIFFCSVKRIELVSSTSTCRPSPTSFFCGP